jgi:hypothetical protein
MLNFRGACGVGLPLQVGCASKPENCLLQLDDARTEVVALSGKRLCAVRHGARDGRSPAAPRRRHGTLPQ